jgi:hypothetical protein
MENLKIKYKFTLRSKVELEGVLIKEYPYKNGKTYLYIKANNGKKYLINPNKAIKL